MIPKYKTSYLKLLRLAGRIGVVSKRPRGLEKSICGSCAGFKWAHGMIVWQSLEMFDGRRVMHPGGAVCARCARVYIGRLRKERQSMATLLRHKRGQPVASPGYSAKVVAYLKAAYTQDHYMCCTIPWVTWCYNCRIDLKPGEAGYRIVFIPRKGRMTKSVVTFYCAYCGIRHRKILMSSYRINLRGFEEAANLLAASGVAIKNTVDA